MLTCKELELMENYYPKEQQEMYMPGLKFKKTNNSQE